MAIVLFDNNERQKLYPLTLTRAVADIQTGIYTFKKKMATVKQSASAYMHHTLFTKLI